MKPYFTPKTDQMKKSTQYRCQTKDLGTGRTGINEKKIHVEQMLSFAEQKYREEIKYPKLGLKRISVDKVSLSEQIEHCALSE